MNMGEFTKSDAGQVIVFDFARQAWFPDDGQPLDANRSARGQLALPLMWETRVGIRSSDAAIVNIERFQLTQ